MFQIKARFEVLQTFVGVFSTSKVVSVQDQVRSQIKELGRFWFLFCFILFFKDFTVNPRFLQVGCQFLKLNLTFSQKINIHNRAAVSHDCSRKQFHFVSF